MAGNTKILHYGNVVKMVKMGMLIWFCILILSIDICSGTLVHCTYMIDISSSGAVWVMYVHVCMAYFVQMLALMAWHIKFQDFSCNARQMIFYICISIVFDKPQSNVNFSLAS